MAKQIESLIDTNVILRFLVGDNSNQQLKAREIFRDAESGKRALRIKVLVVAEACFVLESFYKKSRLEIADTFQVFLSQKWLHVDDRQSLLSLWDHYKKGLHFVDSYLLALAQNNHAAIVTFDKELAKMSRIV